MKITELIDYLNDTLMIEGDSEIDKSLLYSIFETEDISKIKDAFKYKNKIDITLYVGEK